MLPTELVRRTHLMERTSDGPEAKARLVDGLVSVGHDSMETRQLKQITGGSGAVCTDPDSMPRVHGKLMAGALSASGHHPVHAICPDCRLLVRPLLYEKTIGQEHMPRGRPEKLAMAVVDCIRAGAQIINLTLALSPPEPGKKGHWNRHSITP
jgi:hypothetical protein